MDFDFIVYNDTAHVIYQWSIGRAFAMFILIKPLQPEENVTVTDVWPQICNSPPSTENVSVSAGEYYIIGESNAIYGLRTAPTQVIILGS